MKGRGQKERYAHVNAEFQRMVDKKAFLSDQCKEREDNNRVGKTRDLFKKIRDTKGTFYANIGSKMDRNDIDLTEAEEIKRMWQEYTELCKTDINNQDTLIIACSSVQFSQSVISDSLQPHESQHSRPPCPSPTHRVHQTHVH